MKHLKKGKKKDIKGRKLLEKDRQNLEWETRSSKAMYVIKKTKLR